MSYRSIKACLITAICIGVVGVSSNGLFGADAAINAPFSGGAFRLAASYATSDGYVDNVLSKDDLEAVDFKAVRARLRLGDLEGWHATLGFEVVRDDGSRAFGITPTDWITPEPALKLPVRTMLASSRSSSAVMVQATAVHKRSGAQSRIGERIALRAPLTLLSGIAPSGGR